MPKEYSRKLRVNAQLQQELAVVIRDELRDPRVAGITVTAVDVSPDLRNATVMVSLLGPDEQLAVAIKGLTSASGKLRHELGRRMELRVLPQLRFVADRGLREGDRVGGLIRKAIAEDASRSETPKR